MQESDKWTQIRGDGQIQIGEKDMSKANKPLWVMGRWKWKNRETRQTVGMQGVWGESIHVRFFFLDRSFLYSSPAGSLSSLCSPYLCTPIIHQPLSLNFLLPTWPHLSRHPPRQLVPPIAHQPLSRPSLSPFYTCHYLHYKLFAKNMKCWPPLYLQRWIPPR